MLGLSPNTGTFTGDLNSISSCPCRAYTKNCSGQAAECGVIFKIAEKQQGKINLFFKLGKMKKTTKLWEVLFWPPVSEEKYKKNAIWLGCFAALFYAASWGLILFVGPLIYLFENKETETLLTTLNALPHFVFGVAIAIGIYRRNKLATISGLVFSILGLLENVWEFGITEQENLLLIWGIFMFTHSTRAIYRSAPLIPNNNITS